MIKKLIIILFGLITVALTGVLLWVSSILYVFGNTVPETFGENTIDVVSSQEWESERKELIQKFEEHIYGLVPTGRIDWNIESKILDNNAHGGIGVVEELIFSDDSGELQVGVVLVTPKNVAEKVPLVLATNFCANHNAWPQYEITIPESYPRFCDGSDDGFFGGVGGQVMGEFISTYPVKELLDEGIALASFYPGEFVADNRDRAPRNLEIISELTGTETTGAVAGWAWGFLEIMRELEKDQRIDDQAITLYGHSRNGKASLLAAAVDPSVDGVIVHQSGRGGASLSRSPYGETIAQITKRYDYWFGPNYKEWADIEDTLPVDQHELIALVAPRPVVVTGARWDKWGDPKGSFAATRAASVVYGLYGHEFTAEKLTDFNIEEKISFFMRPSFHGVRGSDWEAFVNFITVHFGE